MTLICIPSFSFPCSKLDLDRSPAYPAVLLFRFFFFRRFIFQRQHFISYLIYIQVSHADIELFPSNVVIAKFTNHTKHPSSKFYLSISIGNKSSNVDTL
jgi:hypothetical protein